MLSLHLCDNRLRFWDIDLFWLHSFHSMAVLILTKVKHIYGIGAMVFKLVAILLNLIIKYMEILLSGHIVSSVNAKPF